MRRQVEDAAGADLLFTTALPLAPDAVQRDACIWYLLENAVSMSRPRPCPCCGGTRPVGVRARPSPISGSALQSSHREKDWSSLLEAFRTVRTAADSATIARYAYVIGRAISSAISARADPWNSWIALRSFQEGPILGPRPEGPRSKDGST
jgi:hypothetical protein